MRHRKQFGWRQARTSVSLLSNAFKSIKFCKQRRKINKYATSAKQNNYLHMLTVPGTYRRLMITVNRELQSWIVFYAGKLIKFTIFMWNLLRPLTDFSEVSVNSAELERPLMEIFKFLITVKFVKRNPSRFYMLGFYMVGPRSCFSKSKWQENIDQLFYQKKKNVFLSKFSKSSRHNAEEINLESIVSNYKEIFHFIFFPLIRCNSRTKATKWNNWRLTLKQLI